MSNDQQSTGNVNFDMLNQLANEAINQDRPIPEQVAEVMAQHATNAPQASAAKPAKSENPDDDKIHQLHLGVMVTLAMTNLSMTELPKAALSAYPEGSETYNVYSPFKKKPKDGQPASQSVGVCRAAISELIGVANQLSARDISFLGKPSQAQSSFRKLIEDMRLMVDRSIPIRSQQQIIGADEDQEAMLFNHFVKVSSWLNFDYGSNPNRGDFIVRRHLGMLHLAVQSGQLYDSDEKLSYVQQTYNMLASALAAKNSSVFMVLAVAISSDMLIDVAVRNMISVLLDDNGFFFVSRNSLLNGANESQAWFPPSKAAVNESMFNMGGDFILYKSVEKAVKTK
jgi:hypothetical protein